MATIFPAGGGVLACTACDGPTVGVAPALPQHGDPLRASTSRRTPSAVRGAKGQRLLHAHAPLIAQSVAGLSLERGGVHALGVELQCLQHVDAHVDPLRASSAHITAPSE